MTDLTDGSQEQRVGLTLIEMNFGHDALPGIADDNLCAAVGCLAPQNSDRVLTSRDMARPVFTPSCMQTHDQLRRSGGTTAVSIIR
ncbi:MULTISPECIES: hypothetical protein [unclassified Bradyrhizobium]|uniref:hypothetical protein n=1 Tax=unclassified Bradyrhizobium TaxID=2631580 RepID=UPI0028EE4755|nr:MULTISPECIES: hypothetical protein [unclassified Bradyrhizobium]